MTLSVRQQKRMQAGRARQERQRRREAIVRVQQYKRWLAAGSDFRTMPALPTDGDFRVAERRDQGAGG